MRVLNDKITLLATSFDSKEQVLTKYPETLSSMRELLKDADVGIQHDVDATSLGKSINVCGQHYSDIIFNFPHLGREDCTAHSSMLAHIMHSCSPFLENNGTLTISLAEDQGNRWKIREMAERTNLDLISEIEFKANEWPGYVLMRHHVGRSFGGRVQRCLHYGFRKRNSGVSERSSIFEYLSKQAVGTDSLVLSESLVPPTVAKEAPKVADKNNKVKKRKLDLAVEGHYHKVTLTADISGSSSSSNSGTGAINSFEGVTGEGWQCDYCGKVLATEQGVKTHVYAHVTAASTTATGCVNACEVNAQLQCPHCDKVAPNQDALDQHIGAKHGLNRDIKPAWAQALKSTTAGNDSTIPCAVCGMLFDSDESLQAHLDHGFVPQGLELSYNCTGCGKQFSDERGKLQHENFCLNKTQKEASAIN